MNYKLLFAVHAMSRWILASAFENRHVIITHWLLGFLFFVTPYSVQLPPNVSRLGCKSLPT